MKGGIPFGKAFGISLRLHYSWFIIFALVTWSLAVAYFPPVYPAWSRTTSITAGLITSLLFFGSVLAHELMHSIIAQRANIPVRSITLFIFGGISEITEEPKQPGVEFRMALAGPMTSIVLGVIFWAIWLGTRGAGHTLQIQVINAISFWLAYINITLGIFNLIPGFPLDGGRVLRSILWWRNKNLLKATRTASNIGRGFGYLFIFGGIYLIFTGNWFNGLWLAFIGWFLESNASASYRQLALHETLHGHTVREIMTRDCLTVAPDLTVDRLVNENILTTGRRCYPVESDGQALGLISIHNVRQVPRDQWANKTVKDAMIPFQSLKWVKPTEDLSNVLNLLAKEDVNQLPVVEDNHIVGIIARDKLISFINTRAQLGA